MILPWNCWTLLSWNSITLLTGNRVTFLFFLLFWNTGALLSGHIITLLPGYTCTLFSWYCWALLPWYTLTLLLWNLPWDLWYYLRLGSFISFSVRVFTGVAVFTISTHCPYLTRFIIGMLLTICYHAFSLWWHIIII